jgi:hypothetical protein
MNHIWDSKLFPARALLKIDKEKKVYSVLSFNKQFILFPVGHSDFINVTQAPCHYGLA